MNTLKISCVGAALMELDDLVEFQGELKSLSKTAYQQLRNELEQTGFGFPFRVWRNNGKANIIGGHQTKKVLQKMKEEGWKIPQVPVTFVEATDMSEAKRRVLQDVSQFGKIERQGLYEFMVESNIDIAMLDDFSLPDFETSSFALEFFDGNNDDDGSVNSDDKENLNGAREFETVTFNKFKHLCPKCRFEFD